MALILLLETRLLQYAVQSARRNIITWLAWNSYTTKFFIVLELTMTAACCDKLPTIRLEAAQYFTEICDV